jgi:hypothetical protein
MPVRRMTPEETKAWLGKGIVLSGFKRPKPEAQTTSDTETEAPDNPKNGDGK